MYQCYMGKKAFKGKLWALYLTLQQRNVLLRFVKYVKLMIQKKSLKMEEMDINQQNE